MRARTTKPPSKRVRASKAPCNNSTRSRNPTRPNPLFHIRCLGGFEGDNVQLSGFRIQGPHMGSMDGDDNLEQGIRIESCTGVDISNMELSGWSGAAIYVIDQPEPPLQPTQHTPDAVKVHDNFIHHNQHNGGNGYGVEVNDGAQVTIERNVFDYNRHAIMAGSGPAGRSALATSRRIWSAWTITAAEIVDTRLRNTA